MRRNVTTSAIIFGLIVGSASPSPGANPTRAEIEAALRKAVTFYTQKVAAHGGYNWRYSGDLSLAIGEGLAGADTIWVQPPGTPAVGLALLDAYDVLKDPAILEAARKAGLALASGQLRSGGWAYSVDFRPEERAKMAYRSEPEGKKRNNTTTLDDNTTQASLRFLARLDRALGSKDEAIHGASLYGLDAILRTQAPNGGWTVQWKAYPGPDGLPDTYGPADLAASFPESWNRQWTKAFDGRYTTNDQLVPDMIALLQEADRSYPNDPRFKDAAKRLGHFLLIAQMPEPQPAWAQQYTRDMHPTWARAFEPPAVTGGESQGILESLITLYRWTGDKALLAPIPRAIEYLKASTRPDGRIPRFLELKTNKPLYFKLHPGKVYEVTYSDADLPTHYSFLVESRLARIRQDYDRAVKGETPQRGSPGFRRTAEVIAAMDDRGAWVNKGEKLKGFEVRPESGVIDSAVFLKNVEVLCRQLASMPASETK
jgi:hypothetical protein